MYSHSNHVIKKINDLSSSKFTLKLTDVCGMIFHDPYLMIVKRSLDHVIRNAVMRASQNLNHRARWPIFEDMDIKTRKGERERERVNYPDKFVISKFRHAKFLFSMMEYPWNLVSSKILFEQIRSSDTSSSSSLRNSFLFNDPYLSLSFTQFLVRWDLRRHGEENLPYSRTVIHHWISHFFPYSASIFLFNSS